ncbi:hypothetical protein TNCV_4914291 [Trichonephila clavipes]|nr:hypothetical protein TNCV_4914291 [Trichonephila clavipes]
MCRVMIRWHLSVLADPTRALKGTNRGSRPAIEESENGVSLSNSCCKRTSIILLENCPWGDHLGKVLHGVEEYHQRNVGPLRFHTSQIKWTKPSWAMAPKTFTPAVRAV